ncbi:MAG TPA: fibronectin type III domain-containing protein [Acidimicrobiales bacterium]|nr:fibronectin type III domain-containing protein [Acidimicrobiales bacterium]
MSRRSFLKGAALLSACAAAGGLGLLGFSLAIDQAAWAADNHNTTLGLPSGTTPEQVHLTWGSDPSTAVTVSWASPGSTPQPAPALYYGTSPNPVTTGTSVTPVKASYVDGLNTETVYCYHAALTGLAPSTTYYYVVTDGAGNRFPASGTGGTFTTAPQVNGRPSFVFSSYGDLGTPATTTLAGTQAAWNESSDNAYYAVNAIESAAAGNPLFHLLNGDLCYANLNYNNQPEVWRDFQNNIQRSAANRPWMPALGNHEVEFGVDNENGTANSQTPSQGYWNGAYGHASYQTRFLLPDNSADALYGGVTVGSDYRGLFYKFQVGTVLVISLDADDVIYQDGAAAYTPAGNSSAPTPGPLTTTYVGSGTATNPDVAIPPGTSLYLNQYTGALVTGSNNTLVPAATNGNVQTLWLHQTLLDASTNNSIEFIVVQLHQCPLSTSKTGNGSDLGLRQAWLPLFDQYNVDLVVCGHDHNYERTYPVRGYTPLVVTGTTTNTGSAVVAPNPGQSTTPVDTRQPLVAQSAPIGVEVGTTFYPTAFDTGKGTVFLVLGGGGTNGPTAVAANPSAAPNDYGYDSADGLPQAKVITQRNQIYPTVSAGVTTWNKNGADSVEDAPWSAQRDTKFPYGFATFQVVPSATPGQTQVVMTYYHTTAPANAPSSYTGTVPAYTEYEQVVFGRNLVPTPPPSVPEFPVPAVAVGTAAVIGGAALYLASRDKESATA